MRHGAHADNPLVGGARFVQLLTFASFLSVDKLYDFG